MVHVIFPTPRVTLSCFSNLIPRVLSTFSRERADPGNKIVAFSETKWRKMKGQLTQWKNHSILFVLVWMREFTWSYETIENSEENCMWVILCIIDLILLSDMLTVKSINLHKLNNKRWDTDSPNPANSFLVMEYAFTLKIDHFVFTSDYQWCQSVI